MRKTARWSSDTGFRTKGYCLDFEARLNINGGVEYRIFSDGERIVVIRGESVRSKRNGVSGMLYEYHSCKLGDSGHLEKIIKSEILRRNSHLLAGEYGEVFSKLVDKIRSYGAKSTASTEDGSKANPRPKTRKVSYLSNYKKIQPLKNCQRF